MFTQCGKEGAVPRFGSQDKDASFASSGVVAAAVRLSKQTSPWTKGSVQSYVETHGIESFLIALCQDGFYRQGLMTCMAIKDRWFYRQLQRTPAQTPVSAKLAEALDLLSRNTEVLDRFQVPLIE